MQPSDSITYKRITEELYSKNADLVNANKTFELIQKLYEIMITSYSIESVSQRFIDIITQTLGFTDGIVTIWSEKTSQLQVVGITQTEINKTMLELANMATVQLHFGTSLSENTLVRVFLSGKSETANSIAQIWTPYVKQDDLSDLDALLGGERILVYPIIFGDKILGSFALFLGRTVKALTEFENQALSRLITVFGIAIDRVKINIELQASEIRELSRAKELLKLKDEFVFIATHDLKTPVTAISGFIELIEHKGEPMSPEVVDCFNAIKESSERLKQLTNDLLQVSRNESGTISLSIEKVNINKLLEESCQEVGPSALKRKINVSTKLDAEQAIVLADRARLSEVIENLLSNAIKYNKDGGSVEVTSMFKDGRIVVGVQDTGFGIPERHKDKIFQKFFRARQPGTESVSGTGLGLFVVRMLLERMKGTITFTSTEGVGTLFTFSLPTAP